MNTIFMMSNSSEGANPWSTILMLVMMIAVFYFFMIRPQLKKQKELKTYRESLNKGASVVTIGGVHGKIHSIQDTTIHMKLEDGTLMKIEKSAIITDFAAHQQGSRK